MRLRAAAAAFLSLLVGAAVAAANDARPPPLSSPMSGGWRMAVAREEKVRLGSSPPSCYSKCYECSPCVAVQVPTLSGPAARGTTRSRPADADGAAPASTGVPLVTFSNYKPLGWKCQCRDRLYDP